MSYDEDTSRITKLHDTIGELRAEIERLHLLVKDAADGLEHHGHATDAMAILKALEGGK